MAITALTQLIRTAATFRVDVDNFFTNELPVFVSEANQLLSDTLAAAAAALASKNAAAISEANSAQSKAAAAAAEMIAVASAAIAEASETASAASAANATTIALGATYPAIRPSLNLDFANSQRLDSRINFSRSSTGLRFNADGFLESTSINQPRFDFDPVTFECKGLLLEDQRTNLILHSDDFTNAAWTKSTSTVDANQTAAPDDTLADRITSNSDVGVYQGVAVSDATEYTASIFIKKNSGSATRVLFRDSDGSGHHLKIDYSDGSVLETSNLTRYRVQTINRDWIRVSMTFTTDATTLSMGIRPTDQSGSTSFVVWGMQIEQGGHASSYIPTSASTVTRNADAATISGVNFSNWFNADQGAFVVAGMYDHIADGNGGLWRVDDGSDDNRMFARNNGTGLLDYRVIASSVQSANFESGNTLFLDTSLISAIAYKENDFVSTLNGGNTLTDNTGNIPVVDRLLIGAGGQNNVNALNGCVTQVQYYPLRLSNSELLGLST